MIPNYRQDLTESGQEPLVRGTMGAMSSSSVTKGAWVANPLSPPKDARSLHAARVVNYQGEARGIEGGGRIPSSADYRPADRHGRRPLLILSIAGVVLVRVGKGGKMCTPFVGGKSRHELTRYLQYRHATASDPLWVTVRGTRLTYWGLQQIVRGRTAKAGVPVPSLHSFRRALALCALRNRADIYSLQWPMGHSDLTMLRRYLKQTEADLRETRRRAGPVDNLL